MNSVLEGGAANGAVVNAVPVAEQNYQGTLHAKLSQLLMQQGNSQSVWSHPARVGTSYPQMCHRFLLSLQNQRPSGADPTAVGELHTGGAFLTNQPAGYVEIVKNKKSKPPPPSLEQPQDYLATDTDLHPPGNYQAWDCSPSSVDEESAALSDRGFVKRQAEQAAPIPPRFQGNCSTPSCNTTSVSRDAT